MRHGSVEKLKDAPNRRFTVEIVRGVSFFRFIHPRTCPECHRPRHAFKFIRRDLLCLLCFADLVHERKVS